MSISQRSTYISPEEYLAGELTSPIKHEYIQGQVYAMSGGTSRHNLLSLNTAGVLRSLLRGTRCQIFMADVKVRIEAADTFYYPDVFVTCDERDREEEIIKYNPSLVVEVLSPSNEAFDQGRKRIDYQMLESLKDFLLIRQDSISVEHYYRDDRGQWSHRGYGAGEELSISGLKIVLSVDALYEDIALPETMSN